jgi:predicted DCC family thiol-disulfide oxidoreductase YuxK
VTASQDPEAPIWLFDGHCALCSWAIRFTLNHEREPRIRFVAITSQEGQYIALRHGIDPNDPGTFLFIEKGRALAKSDAALAVAGYLAGLPRLLRLTRLIPRPMRDRLYDWIARNRYRLFGRIDTCERPDPTQHHRFVLPERQA